MSDEYSYNQQQTYQQQSYQQPQGGYVQGGYNQYAPPPPMNYGMVNQPAKGGGWATLLRVTCWILGVIMWIAGILTFMQAQEATRYASYFDSDFASAATGAGIGALLAFVLFGLIIVSAGNLAANHYKLSKQIDAKLDYLLSQSQNRQ